MSDIEEEAKQWLKKNKSKSTGVGTKTQRAQLAAVILAGLIQSNPGMNRYVLVREAYEWADLLLEVN